MSTVTLYPTDDTFVTQPAPNYNFAADKKLIIGNDFSYGLARSWIKFSLASIPAGSTITSATLTLRSFYANNGGTYPPTMFYDLYRCTNNSWSESTITWNNAPNASCGSVIGQYDYYVTYNDVITYSGLESEISSALPSSAVTFRLKLDAETNPGFGEWFADRDYPSSYPVLVIDYTAPTWAKAVNFRATSAYVTDGADETYSLPNTDSAYPITRGGLTFGWSSVYADAQRDRSNIIDRRLAGMSQQPNSGISTFKIDLPSAGTYTIRAAFGDYSFAKTVYAEVLDNTTSLFTLSGVSVSAGSFSDAMGNVYTAANWPGNNVARSGLTFSSTTLILKVGGNGAGGGAGDSAVAHIWIFQDSATAAVISRMLLLGVG